MSGSCRDQYTVRPMDGMGHVPNHSMQPWAFVLPGLAEQTISIARFWYRCRAPMEWAIWAMGPCPVGWGVLPMKKKTWARYTIPETNILSMEEIRRSPVDVGSIQYIPVFIGFLHHPRWLFGISSINSSTWTWMVGRWHFLLGPNACFQVAFAVSFRVSTCYCRFLWLYMSLVVWFGFAIRDYS